MNITLVVMTLNEIEGMKAIMPLVDQNLFYQILVIDGGSTDGTIEYAKEQGYDVCVQKRKGIRFGYIEGYPQMKGDAILTFSPDGNSKPEDLPLIVSKFNEGYDMVIASRHGLGAKSADDDLITGFGNWLFTNSINLFHGGHYTDAMGIYRIYKKSLIEELDLFKEESHATEKLFGTIISIEPLLSIRAAKRKLKVVDVPSDEPIRIGGERKLQILRWGAAYYCQVLREIFYWK